MEQDCKTFFTETDDVIYYGSFYKNWPFSGPFSFIYVFFQANITMFTTILCENCPSSIQR